MMSLTSLLPSSLLISLIKLQRRNYGGFVNNMGMLLMFSFLIGFNRPLLNKGSHSFNPSANVKPASDASYKKVESRPSSSYIQAAKVGISSLSDVKALKPALVLDDSCAHEPDLALSLETKIEKVDLFNIKACWGNINFDYVVSPSVGNSGGILCVWDPNLFYKENSTVSDYFISIMGNWLPNNKKWNGEVLLMGDFNEVRLEEERYGSIFNSRGAAAFNSFIVDSGLVKVPYGGFSFTWSHRLDRFLVSEDLQRSCPNLSSLTLDRYLSDHRPILLRELNVDYGPTPFRFFHNWFDLDGFDSFISATWCNINIIEPNVMFKMAKKLKILKGHICVWVKCKRASASNLKKDLKNKLSNIDSLIDKGKVSSAILKDRLDTLNKLASLENVESSELAQKAKVKWSLEAKKKETMIFKVDFEKAFDSVRWDFLEDILKNFGFGSHWCDWIVSCLKSSKGLVIVNGSPTSEFQFYKGIVLNNSLQLSHLFYADGAIFIVENSLVTSAANNIGCMTLSLPFSYLGVNVGGHMSRIASWDVVINKVLSHLSKWRIKVLSIGGRLTLLKSVLGSTPIYYMSLFKAPVQVINKLEAICSHFFHGMDPSVRKMMLVKWNNVLASKEMGGLGVSSFYDLDHALIFK
nr:RNA-directed DNA polymerase, eukaryota [Tanacetum cinerariifolium]